MPLKNRQVQIPGGLRFLQPETAWRPRRFSSFDSVCDQLIAHRKANPYLIHKNGHTIERSQVENEVDNFNTRVCQQMGWLHFIQGGEALPVPFLVRRSEHKPLPPQPGFVQSLQNVAAGSAAIAEFVANKQEAVADELAISRAATCAACPLNQSGGWLALFTVPVAEAIRKRLEERKHMNLVTPLDDKLGVCSACDCPIPLMIHFPLETKLKHLSEKAKLSLHADCWVLKESGSCQTVS